jgi:hypothetical protein
MTTRVSPAFLLKGLDPIKLLSDYQAGFFSRQITNKSTIKISQNKTILAPTYGNTNHSPVFCVKDRNNCSILIATTGHENYEVFTSTGGGLPLGGRCDFCKEDFDHTAMGYPLGYQEITALTTDDSGNHRYRILYTFWVEGEFCSFECALGWIQSILSRPADFRDTTLRDSGSMLLFLHKLMYPNSGPLRPSQDPKLLRSRKGSLTKEEWKDYHHVYIRTDRVLMIPAKVEYVQQNFLNPVMAIDYPREVTTHITSS